MENKECIFLEIVSCGGVQVSEKVSRVEFPGSAGRFEVLKNHAPIISFLSAGKIRYECEGKEKTLEIKSGFAHVKDNKADVCVEL